MEIKIKAKEVIDSQYSERCYHCLFGGRDCKQLRSFFVNTLNFPPCEKGYIYREVKND